MTGEQLEFTGRETLATVEVMVGAPRSDCLWENNYRANGRNQGSKCVSRKSLSLGFFAMFAFRRTLTPKCQSSQVKDSIPVSYHSRPSNLKELRTLFGLRANTPWLACSQLVLTRLDSFAFEKAPDVSDGRLRKATRAN